MSLTRILPLAALIILSACGTPDGYNLDLEDQHPRASTEGLDTLEDPTICDQLLDLDKDGQRCDDWIFMPGGRHKVGAHPADDRAGVDEDPHLVALRPYFIAATEYLDANSEPVWMTWPGAIALARNLNHEHAWPLVMEDLEGDGLVDRFDLGRGYRLATEAEWEAAAGIGYWPTNGMGCDVPDVPGWYCGNSEGTHHKAGQFPAEGFGGYDMLGNAAEWVWDWTGTYPDQPLLLNPTGPRSGIYKGIKGGGYQHDAQRLRPSDRHGCRPFSCLGGVRLVFQL